MENGLKTPKRTHPEVQRSFNHACKRQISLGFWVFEGKEYMLHLPVCKNKEWLLIDVLSEEADQEQLNTHIIQAGKALLELAFTNEELLQELDVVFLSTEIRMCLIWFMDDLADVYWQA
ncbi:Uncharacterized protein Fot_39336 [Forsythia ovata]|uniref:Uncharacterized protein n=1 Tax=Forsythia ovata TaxID=205694 RepID=A0ABD1S862_9LAMI